MPLSAGTKLGVFEITGSLGAGGMGEVYRAVDTKLEREVAIKTLPAALSGEKDRLARFEREAKLLAALNHAHIASVYNLDEQDGALYIAMELVEGETLENKLKSGPLPIEEALRMALQIAEALEAAHEKGVVHRDLKPANIMVTPNGVVKVLDFGLAKAFSGDPNQASPAHSPALSLAMTQAGLVLGTAGYMSPEQASGQATDQRADVWGFGVVLYEMLTGLPLFRGESVPHILAAVLQTEPDWTRLPKNLHPRLKEALERCLEKKPRYRYAGIADARADIEAALNDPRGVTPAISTQTAGPSSSLVSRVATATVGLAAGVVIAAAAGWLLWPSPPAPAPITRFSVALPDDETFTATGDPMIAVSPDGTRIVYVANNQLNLRNFGEVEARPVPGTAEPGIGAAAPVFSPDGQWLAYVHIAAPPGPYTVKRVPITGGAPVTVYSTGGPPNYPEGLRWPTPETMIFTNAEGVVRIPANGGAPEVLVARGQDERFFSPQVLPGGEAVLFTRFPGQPGTSGDFSTAQIVVQSIGGDDRTVVWEGGAAARYLPTGHLVYAQGNALFAVAFDPIERAVRGGPVPMVDGLRRSSNLLSDAANYGISDTGTLATIPRDPNTGNRTRIQTTLSWVDRDGRAEPFPVRPDDYTSARVSPDGTKVALVVGANLVRDMAPAIWIFDLGTENLSLLTADPAGDDGPVWSSDSSRIFFRSLRGDAPGVYAIELDTGETTLVAGSTPEVPFPLPWGITPDDQTLALVSAATLEDVNIATLSVADGVPKNLLADPGIEENEPSISPDGKWFAYQEGMREGLGSGTLEINIRPFPGASRTRIPVGPGLSPVFSHDASELFFFDGKGLSTAPIEYQPTLRVGAPQRLFESPAYMWNTLGRGWDADPSGQRFLIIRDPGIADDDETPSLQKIDIVLNWFNELESRVPTGG